VRMAQGDLSARVALDRPDEIGLLAHSFNEMAERIEETVTMLRHLVTDAAHELQTPLTALQTNLEMALDEPQVSAREAYLKQAAEQLRRFTALTANLLTLSKIEAGAVNANPTRIVLNDLLSQIMEMYASRAEQAELSLQLDIPDSLITVEANGAQVQRALDNLIDNAIKFTPAGGEVRITLEEQGSVVAISVADTGIGISDEDVPLIFERFHRGRNTSMYAGSGLGLAIVKAIAEAHHGSLALIPQPHGAAFMLTLPVIAVDMRSSIHS
jgi:signal transduction histidine kinase